MKPKISTMSIPSGDLEHVITVSRQEMAKINIERARAFVVLSIDTDGVTHMVSVYDHPLQSPDAGKLVAGMTKVARMIREQGEGR